MIRVVRSLVQIKSHAQKVLKRLEAGENVFRRLDENRNVVDSLIVQVAKRRDNTGAVNSLPSPKSMSAAAKRKRNACQKSSNGPHLNSTGQTRHDYGYAPTTAIQVEQPPGDVIAAAALCQLSSLGAWDRKHQGALQKSC